MVVIQLTVQGWSLHIPFLPDEPTVEAAPFLPAGWAVLVGWLCTPRMLVLEQGTPSPRRRFLRLRWAGVLLTTAVTVAVVVHEAGTFDGNVIARNTVALCGVALLSAAILGGELAWLGPLTVAVVVLFMGKDLDDQVRAWAWPLKPSDDLASLAVSAALAVTGVLAFTLLDGGGVARRQTGT